MKRKLHFLLAVGIGLTTSVGWLHAEGINSLTTLKAAIESAQAGTTITLTGDIDVNHPDGNAGGSAITIKKAITLDGNGHSISGAAMNNILVVEGLEGGTEKDSVMTIKNLKLSNTTHNGLTVYKLDPKHKVILENVQLINNTAAGMVIRSSRVEGKNLIVHSNGWGSINLEGSDAVGDSLSLKLDANSVLAGPGQIWADHSGKDKWFTAAGWDINTSVEGKTYWTNKLSDEGKTYTADFATELQTVLGMINKQNALINKIVLNRDIVLSDLYAAQSNIGKYSGIMNFQKTITLDGQGHTISGTFLPADGSTSYYVIKLDASSAGSTIQNLTIEGTNATALDLITGQASNGSDTTVYVKNVNLYNNTGGGLNNNATAVVAENLHTKGNGHAVRIAVNTSRGKGYANPYITLKGNSLLEESVKIAYNAKENPDTYNQSALARSIADRLSFVNIDTQDKANWKTTWQMASLSKDFKEDNAVLVWTNELNETALAGKKLANMTDASELDSLFTFGGSTVDGIVWTAADKQELTKDITLDRSFAIIGSDKAMCVVKGAVSVEIPVSKVDKDVIFKGLTFDYQPTKQKANERCIPVFWLKDGETNFSVDNCIVNNRTEGYGFGYGDSSYRKMQNVFQSDSTVTGSMIIKNTTVNLLANNQRAISSHGAMDTELVNSIIKGQDSGNQQHGVCVHRDNIRVILDNSTISLSNHYGIWVIKGKGQSVNIKNHSVISGFGALYLMGPSSVQVSVTGGSTLTGVTKNNGPSDSFGALILEGVMNSTVEITDSYIGNQFKMEQTAEMVPILINSNTTNFPASMNNTITLNGKSIIRTLKDETNPFMVDYGRNPDPNEDKNYVIVKGNEVQFKDQNDNDCLIINNQNGAFRNAAVSIVDAIDYGSIYKNEYNHWMIANSGDKVLATNMLKSKALSSLNAATDHFFIQPEGTTTWEAYIVPDSIIIECKDAYLVTGENAAKILESKITDKPVFWLKQGESSFSTIAVGNNRVKVNANTTWNEATNANRSVEIAAGATLTINVAMPLDTVFMAEGAQLQANAAVTTKAVQLTYGATKVWKAFGFPFEIGSVTDKENEAVTTAAQDAATGLWTATIRGTEPVFDVTTTGATPVATCIIAADKDSTILVTSKTTNNALLSLATKAEPNAPVVTKANDVNFQIYSNPNLSDMTLTQTAYVLSDDGKTFDRMVNPTIKAFQSFVLADEATTSTLRSLRIGETPTGNEIVPVDGYFVETGHGTITIHTAEPTQVIVVDMLGRVHYNARVNDGAQIAVPAGIYAVNRQKVIVK